MRVSYSTYRAQKQVCIHVYVYRRLAGTESYLLDRYVPRNSKQRTDTGR